MDPKMNHARAEVKRLSAQLLTVLDDPRIDTARKKAAVDKLEPQMKHWTDEIQALESFDVNRRSVLSGFGGDPSALGGGPAWYGPGDQSNAGGVHMLDGVPRVGGAPSLMPSEDQLRSLHDAVLSHKSLRIEVETKGPSADVPATLVPNMVGLEHEPTRILNLLPSAPMNTPSVAYLRHISTTGTAGTVAPGGLKPAVTLNTDKLEARAKKVAVTTTVNDEDLEDFTSFLSYVTNELQRLVIDQENIQLLTGDGTGENITGIFSTTGILTRVKAVAPETGLDTLELAATDLRTGPAFAPTTVYAMHPLTWSGLRRTKDGQGRYILGEASQADAALLWGVPVVQSTGIVTGTVLAMNAPAAATAHIRKGLMIQIDYGTAGFEHNTTTMRCEERIALAVTKPSAALRVTGL